MEALRHKCTICNKDYKHKQGLKNHVKYAHTGSSHVKCPVCAKMVSKSSFNNHQKLYHNKNKKVHQCPTCRKILASKRAYDAHLNLHLEKRERYGCSICGRSLASLKGLNGHLKMHQRPENFCQWCKTALNNNKELKKHTIMHKKTIGLQCEKCDKVYLLKRLLRRHMISAHFPNHLPCPICDKKLSNKQSLKFHMLSLHETGDDDYTIPYHTCHVCDKYFTSELLLASHVRGHKTARCKYCSKTLTAWAMKKHVQFFHRKNDRARCELCKRVYQNDYYLNMHRKKGHNPKNKFECQECFMRYPTESALARHTGCMAQRGKFKSEVATHKTSKRVSCNLCTKSLANKANLEVHLLLQHSIGGRYQCDHCKKRFPKKCLLGMHMRVHLTGINGSFQILTEKSFQRTTEQDPDKNLYHCDKCHRVFSDKTMIARHFKPMLNPMNTLSCLKCCGMFPTERSLKAHMRYHLGQK